MKHIRIITAALALIALSAQQAHATISYCVSSSGINLLAEGSTNSDGTAHVVNALQGCSNLCTGSNGLKNGYIEFADKDLYAQALTLSNNYISGARLPVVIVFDSGQSPAKGSAYSVTTACRIISLQN